jgi:hypothetical protein
MIGFFPKENLRCLNFILYLYDKFKSKEMSNKKIKEYLSFFLFHKLISSFNEKIGRYLLLIFSFYEGQKNDARKRKMFCFNTILLLSTVVVVVVVGTIFSSSCSFCPHSKWKHRWPCWVRVLLNVFSFIFHLASAQMKEKVKVILLSGIQEFYNTPKNRSISCWEK